MRILATLFTCVLAAAGSAQFAGPGLTWSGTSGSNAGSFVPSCTSFPVTAVVGETVTLQVWGDPLAPFVILAAASGSQCTPVPGLGNALILDAPFFPVAFGALTFITPCLSCPSGYQFLEFAVPPAPIGSSGSLQAVSFGAGKAAFTVAIAFEIR